MAKYGEQGRTLYLKALFLSVFVPCCVCHLEHKGGSKHPEGNLYRSVSLFFLFFLHSVHPGLEPNGRGSH